MITGDKPIHLDALDLRLAYEQPPLDEFFAKLAQIRLAMLPPMEECIRRRKEATSDE